MVMEQGRCAPGLSQDCQQWAMVNFGAAALGDQRRTRRLVSLAAAVMKDPGMSLPKQLPEWSDLLGAYRLLSNAAVDPRSVVLPHMALTSQSAAIHPVVLCVQDDTQLDFTLRTGITGLGITGDGGGRGLVQHTALAVLPDKSLLGILDLAWHAVKAMPEGETRRQRQARWNVRDVWHEAAERIGRWPGCGRLVHVGDRHSDLFRFMHQARQLGHDVVLRAMHDRYVDDRTTLLWDKVISQPPLLKMTVTLGQQRDKANAIKRAGRTAELTVRVAPILVPPPCNDPRTEHAAAVPLFAVYLLEEHPPAGTKAVEWMLLTSLPVITPEDARTIIGYYTCRWVIEEWHRCLKEGCRIEQSQLDDALDIQRLAGILAVVAVRLLQLRDLADGSGPTADAPEALQSAVPPLMVAMVAGLGKVRPDVLTPRRFWGIIAKRGGYLGRKNDPRPGWKVMWRGWTDVMQMVRGAELYRDMLENKN